MVIASDWELGDIETAIETIGWGLAIVWLLGVSIPITDLAMRKLTLPMEQRVASVTVIVPARDEEQKIENCLRSLLSSICGDLCVIAVNDRSQDRTGEIMDAIATDDARLRVIHINELPDGWLGKNHAMSIAASTADTDFLLFTDGDVVFEPTAIPAAVAYAESHKLDHLSLLPSMISGSFMESCLVSFFGLIFTAGIQTWLVRTRFKRAFVGVGAFNLVRRTTYEQIGGHNPIRMDVLDDVKLGRLIKNNGFRSDVLHSNGLLNIRWQSSAWGVIRGLEKNAFASLDYSLSKLLLASSIFAVLLFTPYVGAFLVPQPESNGYVATIAIAHILYGTIGALFGAGWRVIPALPLAAAMILFAFGRSAFLTIRRGGISWRDTFYPLDQLRQGIY